MKCKKCSINFPSHLIQPMCINGKYTDVCPICALKIRNELTEEPEDTPFQGEIAQALYKEAKKFERIRKVR